MSSEKNIYQRINAIMGEIDYIKRGSAGQGTGVLYDEVISDLQPLLIKHGVVVTADFIIDESRKNAKDNYIYEGYFDVHYINMDKPEDKHTSKIVAHAMDSGDKAPGKAITYATKISHLKVFGYETGENDESRAAMRDVVYIDEKKQAKLFALLCDENGYYNEKGAKISKAFGFANISDVKESQFDKVLAKCK